jgi:hypothetical protein
MRPIFLTVAIPPQYDPVKSEKTSSFSYLYKDPDKSEFLTHLNRLGDGIELKSYETEEAVDGIDLAFYQRMYKEKLLSMQAVVSKRFSTGVRLYLKRPCRVGSKCL